MEEWHRLNQGHSLSFPPSDQKTKSKGPRRVNKLLSKQKGYGMMRVEYFDFPPEENIFGGGIVVNEAKSWERFSRKTVRTKAPRACEAAVLTLKLLLH
jgi:hypothetical protein